MTLITLHDNSENHLPSMIDADQVVSVQREHWSIAPLESDTFIVKTTIGGFTTCWDDVVRLIKTTGASMLYLQEFYEKSFEFAIKSDVEGDRKKYGRKFTTQEQAINNARGMLRYLTAKGNYLVPTKLSRRISEGENIFRYLPSTMDMLIEAVPDAALVSNWTRNDVITNTLLRLHDERCTEGHFPGFEVGDKTKSYYKPLDYFQELIEGEVNNSLAEIKTDKKEGNDNQ